MTLDPERFLADLDTLAGFGADGDGGVSRPSFSGADAKARRWLAERAEAAGLAYREDAAANSFCRLDGPPGPAVWVGSHLDSVPNGGPLDGALGVVAALEVVRSLAEEGLALARPVEVVSFTDEEGAYTGFLGSKSAMGELAPADLEAIAGRDGTPLVEAMRAAGYDPSAIGAAAVDPADVAGYLELHIEQGAILHEVGLPIGVVTHIVGVGRVTVEFGGRADHAGTTPMWLRRDAARGAADLLAALPGLPAEVGAGDAVVTCGRLSLAPGADNIVPGRATLHLDMRDRDRAAIEALEAAVAAHAEAAAAAHGLEATLTRESLTDPTPLDSRLVDVVAASAEAAGLASRRMPSGAGHDAQVVAPHVPAAMVFVPSIDGRSHSPLERTGPDDLVAGLRVLHGAVRRLATEVR
ncbi:MAG: Zn-dependent hydrolase [Actinomycetota bacterium]